MGRKPSQNPRRERRVFYLTKSEADTLDKVLADVFPRYETTSDRVREMALDWLAQHGGEPLVIEERFPAAERQKAKAAREAKERSKQR